VVRRPSELNQISGDASTAIGYAVGQANAGDTVSVASGTYNESVIVAKRLDPIRHRMRRR